MNKRGSTLFLSILAAVMIIMAGFLFVNHLKDDVTTARDPSQLDCANLSISDGNKATCLAADIAVPYAFVLILTTAGGIILAKLLI